MCIFLTELTIFAYPLISILYQTWIGRQVLDGGCSSTLPNRKHQHNISIFHQLAHTCLCLIQPLTSRSSSHCTPWVSDLQKYSLSSYQSYSDPKSAQAFTSGSISGSYLPSVAPVLGDKNLQADDSVSQSCQVAFCKEPNGDTD